MRVRRETSVDQPATASCRTRIKRFLSPRAPPRFPWFIPLYPGVRALTPSLASPSIRSLPCRPWCSPLEPLVLVDHQPSTPCRFPPPPLSLAIGSASLFTCFAILRFPAHLAVGWLASLGAEARAPNHSNRPRHHPGIPPHLGLAAHVDSWRHRLGYPRAPFMRDSLAMID